MISTVQAGMSTAGAGPFAIQMSGPNVPASYNPPGYYEWIQVTNFSTNGADGWLSIDGGQSWIYIPVNQSGAPDSSNSLPIKSVGNLQPVIQRRGAADLTVFVTAGP